MVRLLFLLALVLPLAVVAEEPPRPPDTTAAAPQPPKEPAPHTNAGFGNEVFFIRSDDDNFILIPTGRFQFDFYAFQPGTKQLPEQFLPRRARIEVQGSLLKRFDFMLASDFALPTAPIATDVYLVGAFSKQLNLQVGQYDTPFTMDGRTSDKWTDLQERSTVVRAIGIPENKQIGAMVWGQPEKKFAYWSLGVFNGEGQDVLPHRSNGFSIIGRGWYAPFGGFGYEPLKNAWLGASVWSGFLGETAQQQVDRGPMRDQAGFAFFPNAIGDIHIGNAGHVRRWGVELNVPVSRFVLKSEYVYTDEGLREVNTAQKNAVVRRSQLTSKGFYVRLSYFVWGDILINGLGGMQNPPHLYEGPVAPGKTADALQLVAEFDRITFENVAEDGATPAQDAFLGDGSFDAVTVGANYWLTKHLRFTGNAIVEQFGGAALRPLISSDRTWVLTFRAALVY